MPNVVVRLPRRDARAQGQQRAGAIERLHLTFFVDAEHDRVVRRIEVQAHDIAHLLDKLRVGRQLEGLDPMRLQPKGPPDARDRRFREAQGVAQASGAPLGPRRRRRLQRAGNDLHDSVVRHRARHAGSGLVVQPRQPAHTKAFAPRAHAVARHPQLRGHGPVRPPLGTGQHDLRAPCHPLRRRRASRPLSQDPAFVVGEQQRFVMTCSWHAANGTNPTGKVQGFF